MKRRPVKTLVLGGLLVVLVVGLGYMGLGLEIQRQVQQLAKECEKQRLKCAVAKVAPSPPSQH